MRTPESGKENLIFDGELEQERRDIIDEISALSKDLRVCLIELMNATDEGMQANEDFLKNLSEKTKEFIKAQRSLLAKINITKRGVDVSTLKAVHPKLTDSIWSLRNSLIYDPPINRTGQEELLKKARKHIKYYTSYIQQHRELLSKLNDIRSGVTSDTEDLSKIFILGPDDEQEANTSQADGTTTDQNFNTSTGNTSTGYEWDPGQTRGSGGEWNPGDTNRAQADSEPGFTSNEQAKEPDEEPTRQREPRARRSKPELGLSYKETLKFILRKSDKGAGRNLEVGLEMAIQDALKTTEIAQPTEKDIDETIEVVASYLVGTGLVSEVDRTGRKLSHQEILESALAQRKPIKDIFTAALSIYLATENTQSIRTTIADTLKRRLGNKQSPEENRFVSGAKWLTSFAATTSLASIARAIIGSHGTIDPAISFAVGTAGTLASKGLQAATSHSSFRTEVLKSLANLERKNLISDTSAESVYAELLKKTEEHLSNPDRLSTRDLNESVELLEQLAYAKTRLELSLAIKTAPESHDGPEVQLAQLWLHYRNNIASAESERYEKLKELTKRRLFEHTGRRAWDDTLQSIAWGSIGAAFSLTANLSPNLSALQNMVPVAGFSFSVATASMLRKPENRWAVGLVTERMRRANPEAEKNKEKDKVPGWRYYILPAVDELAFYVDMKIGAGQKEDLQEKIAKAQKNSPDKLRSQIDILQAALFKTPEGPHGYWFVTKNDKGELEASRIWPFPMERGTTWVNSDLSNWPDQQDKGEPLNTRSMRFGKFYTRKFKIKSLYDVDIVTKEYQQKRLMFDRRENGVGEEFKNSWNMPEEIWRPIDKSPISRNYTEVLTVKTPSNKMTQILIRPDLIGRISYELVEKGLSLESLQQAMLEAHEEHEEDIEKIIARAHTL